jgi:hypothetical protein
MGNQPTFEENHGLLGVLAIPEVHPLVVNPRSLVRSVDAPEPGLYHRVVLLLDVLHVEDFAGAQASLEAGPLLFQAREPGAAGNAITVEFVDPEANDAPLTIAVVNDTEINISLATNAGGTITSTALQVLQGCYATPPVAVLVHVGLVGTGAEVMQSAAVEALAGGVDAVGGILQVQLWDGGTLSWQSPEFSNDGSSAASFAKQLVVSGAELELRCLTSGLVQAQAVLMGYNARYSPPEHHRWESI